MNRCKIQNAQNKKSALANQCNILCEDKQEERNDTQRIAQYFLKVLKFKHKVNETKERCNIETIVSKMLEILLKDLNGDHI